MAMATPKVAKRKKKSFLTSLFGCSSLCPSPTDYTAHSVTASALPGETASGYMQKLGGKSAARFWQKRLCVVRGSELFYYKDRGDKEAKGVIRLIGASFYFVKGSDKACHFRIKHPDHKVRDLACEDEKWLELWIDVVQRCIDGAGRGKFMAGWVFKKDKRGKGGWKRRYAIVDADKVMRYYEGPDDLVHKGELNLHGATVTIDDATISSPVKSPAKKADKFTFTMQLPDQRREFYVESWTDRKKWVESIERASGGGEDGQEEEGVAGKKFVVKGGWLMKKGGGTSTMSRRNWKRRYCVLTRKGELLWFDTAVSEGIVEGRENEANGRVMLFADRDIKVVTDYPSKYNHMWKIEGADEKRVFEFRAEEHEEKGLWIGAIKRAIEGTGEFSGGGEDADANMV